MHPEKPAPNKPTDGSAAASSQRTSGKQSKGAWALWVGVVIMFLLVITAWTTLINIAKDNPVERIDVKSTE